MLYGKDENGFFVSSGFNIFYLDKVYYDPYKPKDKERAEIECKRKQQEREHGKTN